MIDLLKANYAHSELIDEFGGSKGIRDQGGLEAALHRPYATFDGIDLYPTVVEKAAAIFESIIINHPFIDGNKRVAYALMRSMLIESDFDIAASKDDKYEMTIAASKGEIGFDEIKQWLAIRIIENNQ
ncbi:MAG TPA: type II toxin-antitoxin system death-on-curing family toxin [Mucilaginibacter sp.]